MNALRLTANALTTRPDAPWILDLFCGAGGAGMGYWLAGFNVVGVDIVEQPRYPFWFIKGDALKIGAQIGHYFNAIHASPPCQFGAMLTPIEHRANHKNLIPQTREVLRAAQRLYVIENIPDNRRHLENPIKLCGSGFGLGVWRHRFFELGLFDILLVRPCQHDFKPVLVSGSPGRYKTRQKESTTEEIRQAIGIDWMIKTELDQAIPPAYTHYIGGHMMRALGLEGGK